MKTESKNIDIFNSYYDAITDAREDPTDLIACLMMLHDELSANGAHEWPMAVAALMLAEKYGAEKDNVEISIDSEYDDEEYDCEEEED